MKNKRIAHFIETGVPGGAETLMLKICQAIQQSGNHPIVLHNGHEYFVEQCQRLGIEQYVPAGYEHFKSTKTLPLFALKFKTFLKQQNIDLLHSHLYGPITGAAIAARLAGVPHIGTLHDVYMIEEKPSRIRLLQLACWLGTRLVTVSKTMNAFYRDSAFFKSEHISTIYNGVEIKTLDLVDKRAALQIAAQDCVIANVGRLVSLKRHDLLLQAVSQLDRSLPWRLLIVGDGPERKAIETDIEAKQLQDKVIMLGQRQDVTELLTISDIFVQCSDTEGLSMSIMEAMAAGLPGVVTDVGGNQELIEDHKNGYLTPPGQVDILAERLQQLITQTSIRQAMRLASLDRVQELFNIDVTFQQYLAVYQEMMV